MKQKKEKKEKEIVAFTSTIPVEIIFAANKNNTNKKNIKPLDLNNIFISSDFFSPSDYIDICESDGFPRNFCAWTKGLYGVIKKHHIKKIVAVVEGDCSSNKALFESLENFSDKTVELIYFSYLHNRDKKQLLKNIEELMQKFDVNWTDVAKIHKRLSSIRQKIKKLDEMAYLDCCVNSFDLHLWQVSCSDFMGDYEEFEQNLDKFLANCTSQKKKIRLGYIGVPPIVPELYNFLESQDARVIFNEVQRQFAFIDTPVEYDNLEKFKQQFVEQYLNYTYPYDLKHRIEDINTEIKKRKLDGIIHYVQSFCHKQVNDISFRQKFPNIPILTIEEDKPGVLSERTKIRVEAFLGILKQKTGEKKCF